MIPDESRSDESDSERDVNRGKRPRDGDDIGLDDCRLKLFGKGEDRRD